MQIRFVHITDGEEREVLQRLSTSQIRPQVGDHVICTEENRWAVSAIVWRDHPHRLDAIVEAV